MRAFARSYSPVARFATKRSSLLRRQLGITMYFTGERHFFH